MLGRLRPRSTRRGRSAWPAPQQQPGAEDGDGADDEDARAKLGEVDDKLHRHLDHLEELRQRAALLHEELATRIAEQTNRNTLLISIVSVVMLPMSFVTGFFGMNTGKLPFSGEDAMGTFWASVVIFIVGAVTIISTWLLLRRRPQ